MAVVVVSGGADSVTLLYHAVQFEPEVVALSFHYGQKHSRELHYANWHATRRARTHIILDISTIAEAAMRGSALTSADVAVPHIKDALGDPQPASYVPNRNMIFLSIAAGIAEAEGYNTIYYGAQKHDLYGYWDTTTEFVSAMNMVIAQNRKHTLKLVAPFLHMSKTEVIARGLELGVDYSQTWSCYQGKPKACGVCPTCAERLQAFANLGIPDPIRYEGR